MNNKFVIVTLPFLDWEEPLKINKHIIICKGDTLTKNILPISLDEYAHQNSIFKNKREIIRTLNNKSIFGKFMKSNFPEFIPKIYYYDFLNEKYISEEKPPLKLIQKPNIG